MSSSVPSGKRKSWPFAKDGPLDSVGAYKGVLFPGLIRSSIHCWEAKGEALKLFNGGLKASIIDFLHQNSGRIHESDSFLSLTLFMVGKRAERTKPVVMFVADDKVARKEAFDMVRESHLLSSYSDFELGHTDLGTVMAFGGDLESRDVFYRIPEDRIFQCVRIFTKQTCLKRLGRMATGGGLVLHHGVLMLLTVNHFLEESYIPPDAVQPDYEMTGAADFDDDSDDNDVGSNHLSNRVSKETSPAKDAGQLHSELTGIAEFDGDDDDDDDLDICHGTSQGSLSGISDRESTEEPSSIGSSSKDASRSLLEENDDALANSHSTYIGATALRSRTLDFALVKLSGLSSVILNAEMMRLSIISTRNAIETQPRQAKVWTVTPSGGTIEGSISGEIHHIRPPRSKQFVEVFKAKFNWPLSPGDCGSWVRDASTSRLFGHVIAANPTDGTAIIMPAYTVFDHIMASADSIATDELDLGLPDTSLTPLTSATDDNTTSHLLWRQTCDPLPELSDNTSSVGSWAGSTVDFSETTSSLRNDVHVIEEEEGEEDEVLANIVYPDLWSEGCKPRTHVDSLRVSMTGPDFKPEEQTTLHRVGQPGKAPRRSTTKEQANFVCEVEGCYKMFSRDYNFEAHMKTHDKMREYPFVCAVGDCSKKFVRKTDLRRHQHSVHMRDRLHKCRHCARLFARKDTLRRHEEDGCSRRFDIGTLDPREDVVLRDHLAEEASSLSLSDPQGCGAESQDVPMLLIGSHVDFDSGPS